VFSPQPSRQVLDKSNGLAVDFDLLSPLCFQKVDFGLIVPQLEDYHSGIFSVLLFHARSFGIVLDPLVLYQHQIPLISTSNSSDISLIT
jgi:hypothetical protein